MHRFAIKLVVLIALTVTVLWCLPEAGANVRFEPPENMQATKQELKEIGQFFDSIEEVLAKEDLDKMMTFYADNYYHRGLTKDQVRGIWKDIFAKFDKLHSVHVFSRVMVVDDEGLVVCTGTLLGVPSGSKGKKYVTVDSWAEQNHYIFKKDGSWKITGGSSHKMLRGKNIPKEAPGRPLGFHPLY